jgi:hypothetical protein
VKTKSTNSKNITPTHKSRKKKIKKTKKRSKSPKAVFSFQGGDEDWNVYVLKRMKEAIARTTNTQTSIISHRLEL